MRQIVNAIIAKILNVVSQLFVSKRIKRILYAVSIVLLLPGVALAEASGDTDTRPEPAKRTVEQRIVDQRTRILEQIKGSVCGTGPFYAGNVDEPIFATPLIQTTCTVLPAPPDGR